jgi:hypothetical protein
MRKFTFAKQILVISLVLLNLQTIQHRKILDITVQGKSTPYGLGCMICIKIDSGIITQ